jgi:hypothetical protein
MHTDGCRGRTAKRKKDTMELTPTLHSDGTLTYWSVFHQHWTRGIPPVRELAAMSAAERDAAIAHVRSYARTDELGILSYFLN